jgi:dienelactone hydrolase
MLPHSQVVAPDFFDAKLVEFKQREWIWAKLTDAMNLLCNPMQAWSRVTMPYAKVESKVNATILPWIRQQTTGKIGLIGFCWVSELVVGGVLAMTACCCFCLGQ